MTLIADSLRDLMVLHVADATVVRPWRFWSDAFLTDGHRRDMNSILKQNLFIRPEIKFNPIKICAVWVP